MRLNQGIFTKGKGDRKPEGNIKKRKNLSSEIKIPRICIKALIDDSNGCQSI